jgi:hypothetical protein
MAKKAAWSGQSRILHHFPFSSRAQEIALVSRLWNSVIFHSELPSHNQTLFLPQRIYQYQELTRLLGEFFASTLLVNNAVL